MELNFYKYQGAGNDFIMVNGFNIAYTELNTQTIARFCNRRFGIGADGLIVLIPDENYIFRMKYYNSDGKEATMCGNGGRCAARFAFNQNLGGDTMQFIASDGLHLAQVNDTCINLKMQDVTSVKIIDGNYFLNTGVPHYIIFVDNLEATDVIGYGRKYRYDKKFGSEGTNVNFVENKENFLKIRTYERGVEDETLACGTGAIASAIAAYLKYPNMPTEINLRANGGTLAVSYDYKTHNHFRNVWLKGPAKEVFNGRIMINGL